MTRCCCSSHRHNKHTAATRRLWMVHVLLVLCCYPNLLYNVNALGRPIIKIYVMIGADNVEGRASVGHLHNIATDEQSPEIYHELMDAETGTWKIWDNVYVTYDHERSQDWIHGPLTVTGFASTPTKFGPEVGFGSVLSKLYAHNGEEHPIVIIKAGWAGRNLVTDFRSPDASDGDSEGAGFQWFRLLNSITQTVTNFDKIFNNDPKYRRAKHKIEGVVWWHGYPDLLEPINMDGRTNGYKMKSSFDMMEYEQTMLSLFSDLRTSLQSPGLRIIVGELGGGGLSPADAELNFRWMQVNTTNRFHNYTTKLVETAKLVDRYMMKQQQHTDGEGEDGDDGEEDVIEVIDHDGNNETNDDPGDQIDDYTHYYGRADIMFEIGQAFGIEMARMVDIGDTFDSITQNADVIGNLYEENKQIHIMIKIAIVLCIIAFTLTIIRKIIPGRRSIISILMNAIFRPTTSHHIISTSSNDDKNNSSSTNTAVQMAQYA